jgi:hypothetical protein
MKPKHSKEVNTIYQTTDYGMFKFDPTNRPVDDRRVNQLVKSMLVKGFINQPIKVTTKMVVVDGQHRLTAAKIAKKPVLYFIDESKGTVFDKAASSNRLGKMWSKQNYLDGLAAKGIKPYVILSSFQKKYPDFRLTELINMLSNGNTGVTVDDFASGKFQVKDVYIANKWAADILKLKPYYNDYKKSLFVRSLIEVMKSHPEFDFDKFFDKVQKRPAMLHPCGDRRQYKQMIETVYNYHRRGDDRIYLRY